MKRVKLIAGFLVLGLGLGSSVFASTAERRTVDRHFSSAAKDISSFQDAFIQNLRLIRRKQELQMLEDSANFEARRAAPQSADTSEKEVSGDSTNLLAESVAADPDAALIYGWFNDNQKASSLGLVTSYPDDPALSDQAFTYDQALSGILLLQQGDTPAARKIFDFYDSQWDGGGFWTVYNSRSVNGSKVEYDRIMGPNAWVAIFALQYHSKTGDARGLDLATKVGRWVRSLPHKDGGVAMGSSVFWSTKFSVENNLSYYGVLKILSVKAASRKDRQLFSNELKSVKNWLKTQAYDPATGLFRRGAYGDNVKSMDTNSWAVLAIGADSLKKDFGIDVNSLVSKTESTFSVQADGSFNRDVLTASGFDFSDAVNASAIGRTGIKWVEGTNHMIAVYKQLAAYYSKPQTRDSAKAAYYQNRADYFASQNVHNSLSQNGTVSYTYTDRPGAQIYSDNPYWTSASGSSAASSAWVYYSIYGFNPFS